MPPLPCQVTLIDKLLDIGQAELHNMLCCCTLRAHAAGAASQVAWWLARLYVCMCADVVHCTNRNCCALRQMSCHRPAAGYEGRVGTTIVVGVAVQ